MPTNTETALKVFEAINAHDTDALREVWASGVTERMPDKTCHGPDELAEHFRGLFAAMPDLRMEAVSHVEDGERVFVRWHLTGNHTGAPFSGIERTGASIRLDGMDEITIRDGKVVSNFVVFDQMEVGRQLGLLPPDGSAADRALKAAFNAKTKVAEAIRQRRSAA
jgi:predicted ester cyclase